MQTTKAAATRPRGLNRPGRPKRSASGSGTDSNEGEGLSAEFDVAERLLVAATELAVEQGFDACGLREIAARAQVSSGMISYYFGDRRGLHEAMFQRAIDRVSEQVSLLLEADDYRASDRLNDLIHLHVSAVAADPWLPKLILRELMGSSSDSFQASLADQVGKGPMPMLVDWIRDEQARGILRTDLDAGLIAVSIVSLSIFPFMMLPAVGESIGVEIDSAFTEKLIQHNQKLLGEGVRSISRTDESIARGATE